MKTCSFDAKIRREKNRKTQQSITVNCQYIGRPSQSREKEPKVSSRFPYPVIKVYPNNHYRAVNYLFEKSSNPRNPRPPSLHKGA